MNRYSRKSDLEDLAESVVDEPVLRIDDDFKNESRPMVLGRVVRIGDDHVLLHDIDEALHLLVRLHLVDLSEVPVPEHAVFAGRHDVVVDFGDRVDHPRVAGLRLVDRKHRLDEVAFPQQEPAVLRPGDHFAVREDVEARDVAQLH